MRSISEADYQLTKRLLQSLVSYPSATKIRQDEARRKASLLLKKFNRRKPSHTTAS